MSGSAKDSFPNKVLDPLQRDLLDAFFEREQEYFLTGGAALAGFFLGHRRTKDLDLSTLGTDLTSGVRALEQSAYALRASIEALRTSPAFQRFLVRRDQESVVVDLVAETVPQASDEKTTFGSIRVDPPEEVFANKLCPLLSRAELRDLVDLRALENAGFDLETAWAAASQKDRGLTPGQLGWVLSEIGIGDDASPPGVDVVTLRAYVTHSTQRLAAIAHPGYPESGP